MNITVKYTLFNSKIALLEEKTMMAEIGESQHRMVKNSEQKIH